MNPLKGMTIEKIRDNMHAANVSQQAHSILANLKYSIELGRPYCMLQDLHDENASLLLQNGFGLHQIAVKSNMYGSVFQHWVLFWGDEGAVRREVESAYMACSVDWTPHRRPRSLLSRIFGRNSAITPAR